MTGLRFGRLTVIKRVGTAKSGHPKWLCKCDCGNEKIIEGGDLRRKSRRTLSCGCYRSDMHFKHGHVNTVEYRTWQGMIARCYNENIKEYRIYGARGITVCPEWRESFEQFLKDMGYKPDKKLSLDRIDVNGNYEPGNCRWTTYEEQSRNQRVRPSNNTGYRGIRCVLGTKKYIVTICAKGKHHHIGTYCTLEEAIKARKEAELKYWGKYYTA